MTSFNIIIGINILCYKLRHYINEAKQQTKQIIYNMSEKDKNKPIRVYADGVFDSFHIGHANLFKQCRETFPDQKIWLIAGVCDQEDIEIHKGPTISSEQERIQMCRQCKWVDQVLPHAPWIITQQFLTKYNIDFVCHDDIPYVTAGIQDAYALCKQLGKFKATKRTQGISTTDVVAKILKNKQMYYIRNLKRGVPRSQLGLSLTRYVYLQCKLLICPPRMDKRKRKSLKPKTSEQQLSSDSSDHELKSK